MERKGRIVMDEGGLLGGVHEITILVLMSVELGGTIYFCPGAHLSVWCKESLLFITILLHLQFIKKGLKNICKKFHF